MTTVSSNPVIPGYQISSQLYVGSRTRVYRAIREPEILAVVIKMLTSEYPSFNELLQFRHQYTISKNLNIPGIIRPLSLEAYGNGYILVMADCGEISLQEYIKTTNLSLIEFLAIAIQLTNILHSLHQNRVIHKDIKPANILIHPQTKQVSLIDFSIASLLPKETQEIKSPNILEGTLAYISPEQTGRMNRGLDYRSDFYSLGVTFYELLTGELPFISDDPMEVVHCHIAKMPPAINSQQLSVISEEIPEVLSDIVMRLMAKNAEDRYQSALGLRHDLENCLDQLKKTGRIESFEIGQRDVCDRFMIPEKLYGREKEIKILLEVFERVAQGGAEMMLVAGFSGIGKTALINEVHKPITRKRGYFIKGKFDQFHRNIPLSAFVQALRDLMGQLLSETDVQLVCWKTKILEVVRNNGQVLIEVIPELEHIIGKQPPAPELSGIAAQNRFNLLFQKFIQIFTTKEHPLVMFLDDLQWADSASLALIKLLMQDNIYLLLLGAYRDNEVQAAHPFILMVEELKKAQKIVNIITLSPLVWSDINQLVADTLDCPTERSRPLTELILRKTQGNPFFITQFLKALYEEGQIKFNRDQGYWECDIAQINALSLTDDVLELMAQQLQKLPQQTQQILKLAACIGNQFDLATLAIISEHSQVDTATALWKALQEGLILPQSQVYKFYLNYDEADVKTSNNKNVGYRFLHDRVQQAAYSLIPENQKQATHVKIGRLLWQNTSESQLEEQIFAIANQLNIGIEHFQPTERHEIAQLNFMAGKKAKASTAYSAAITYLKIGIELLPYDSWQSDYNLTLNLYSEATETSFLCDELEAMEDFAQEILQHVKVVTDKAKVYEVKIEAYTVQGQLFTAIDTAMQFLQPMGIEFPEEPTIEDFVLALQETQTILNDKKVADLVDLPEMQNPELLAILRVLVKVSTPAYLGKPQLHRLLVLKQITLSVQHGNTSTSAFAYSTYGLILCGQPDSISTGYEFGQLALQLLSKFPDHEYKARVILIVHHFVTHWQEPVKATLKPLREAYTIGLDSGDLAYAGYVASIYCFHAYIAGQELNKLANEFTIYSAVLEKINQKTALNYHKIYHQVILNLIESKTTPWELIGAACDERSILMLYEQNNDHAGLFQFYVNKFMFCYLFQSLNLSVEYAAKAKQYSGSGYATPIIPLLNFYDSLLQLALFPQSSATEQQMILQQVVENQATMQKWANYAPMNHLHRFQLVEAEKCRVLGQKAEAIELYDKAISGAKENEYIQEEALANELAAKFYLNWNKEKVAQAYMQEAYYCYTRWGAKAKVAHLEQQYPQLLTAILQPNTPAFKPTATIGKTVMKSVNSTNNDQNLWLDLPAVMKSAQAISQEMKLDKLLATLMQIAIANAGAQVGCLVLHQEEKLLVVAQGNTEQVKTLEIPLEQYAEIPQNLIYTVARTQETAVFENLSNSVQFASDRYIITHQPKSVLCTPMIRQGKLVGILYLENNLTIGAFTSDRIEILQLLTSQAAISVENARLYQQTENYAHTLEAEVERQTQVLKQKAQDLEETLQKLQQTQAQLIHSEKMSSLGQMVAGIAHEINNPVSFIKGNLSYTERYINDLISLLTLYQLEYPQPSPVIQAKMKEIDFDFLFEDVHQILESMNAGSDRISQIVQSLRNFSRLDEAEIKTVDLHSGMESTLLIVQHRLQATENQPEIWVIKEYGDIPLVTCYPSQLNQVFFNIINNAIDAIRDNPECSDNPEIRIRTEVIDNEQLRIAIANTDSIIPASLQDRIFEPFFTTKPVGRGKGLGLFVSYSIIQQHGGHLTVRSQPTEGTEFEIILPIQSVNSEQ